MLRKISVFIFAIFLSTSAQAWDVVGHRIVAEVAYHVLTDNVREQVDMTLGYHRALIYTSAWADEIKSDTVYKGQSEWHFQDTRPGYTDDDMKYLYNNKKADGKHLFAAVDSLINELKQHKDNADALKFIVHLYGDYFQPMHVGYFDDRGGNDAKMTWFGNRTNMHTVWDRWLINHTQYSSSEFAQYIIDRFESQQQAFQNMTELDAICKTHDTVTRIYQYYEELGKQVDKEGRLPRGYEYKYAYTFHDSLCEQLYMAGIQLAKVLNDIYK